MQDRVEQILARVEPSMVLIAPSATVAAAVRVMEQQSVDSILVIEEGSIVGVFTQFDALWSVVHDAIDPETTEVSGAMAEDVISIDHDATVSEALALMTLHRLRSLPVVDGKTLLGVVTLQDVAHWLARENGALTDYIAGVQIHHELIYPAPQLR
jgi:CBS domain-containing protein